jgi:PAS domain S-box-containing protein
MLPTNDTARFKRLFDSELVGILIAEMDGTITEANNFFLGLLGYTQEDLPLRWNIITPPEWRHFDRAKIMQSLMTRPGISWEKEAIGKHGRPVHFLVGALMAEKGHECIFIVLDRTKEKEAELQLLEGKTELRSLAAAVLQAEEEERRRIARGLHDDISQTLAVAKSKVGALRKAAQAGRVEFQLQDALVLIDQAIQATRTLTFELSSPVLYELGLAAALQTLGEQVEQEHGLQFQFTDDAQPKPLAENVSVMLYRIARELMVNIVRHARARNASIALNTVGNRLQLTVEDDGVGFVAAKTAKAFAERGGFGLFSVRQQLEHIGGHLEIGTSPGEGTRVVVLAPLSSGARKAAAS